MAERGHEFRSSLSLAMKTVFHVLLKCWQTKYLQAGMIWSFEVLALWELKCVVSLCAAVCLGKTEVRDFAVTDVAKATDPHRAGDRQWWPWKPDVIAIAQILIFFQPSVLFPTLWLWPPESAACSPRSLDLISFFRTSNQKDYSLSPTMCQAGHVLCASLILSRLTWTASEMSPSWHFKI